MKVLIVGHGDVGTSALAKAIAEQHQAELIVLKEDEPLNDLKELINYKVKETRQLLDVLEKEIAENPMSGQEKRRERRKKKRKH